MPRDKRGRVLRCAMDREREKVETDAIVRAERVIAGLTVSRAEADAAQIARHVLTNARAAPPGATPKAVERAKLVPVRRLLVGA